MQILAIESSCDETSVAVVKDYQVLSNIIASQIDLHAQYGGVVPEVAARSHIEAILPVVEQSLQQAKTDWDSVDAIAVTKGPGLLGSLFIGTMAAQTLAYAKKKPLIAVNHIWAHGFAAFLTENKPEFPFLALTVSGGHTTLSLYRQDLTREVVGETLDDAAGEAFDKVARLLGLLPEHTYHGGPVLSKAAEDGDADKYRLPVARLGKDSLDFSFSGLKTAVLRLVQEIAGVNPGALSAQKTYQLEPQVVADIAASFQKAVITALVQNTLKAHARLQPKSVVVGGGVACNTMLRSSLHQVLPQAIFVPPVLCTDNAAMIAALASKMAEHNMYTQPFALVADSSLEDR